MKTILAAINLVLAAGFGALRIYRVSKGDEPSVEKVVKVRDELARILDKLDKLAVTTIPEWDDSLADILSVSLEAIASALIEQLGGTL